MLKEALFSGGDSGNGLKNKYRNRGVSPVIGVILMVVITVILAGVVAVSFMGFGDQVDEGAPQASFEADFDTGNQGEVQFTHVGGDEIDGNLKVMVDGKEATTESGTISAGSQITAENFDDDGTTGPDAWAGEDVRLVYDDGQGNTATLYTGEAPN